MAVSRKCGSKESSNSTMFHGCSKRKKIEDKSNGNTVEEKGAWRLQGDILPE